MFKKFKKKIITIECLCGPRTQNSKNQFLALKNLLFRHVISRGFLERLAPSLPMMSVGRSVEATASSRDPEMAHGHPWPELYKAEGLPVSHCVGLRMQKHFTL